MSQHTISELEKRGFYGPDADIATSIFEYGLVWKVYKIGNKKADIKRGDVLFYYGIDTDDKGNYCLFDWARYTQDSFNTDFDWADFDAVAKWADMDVKIWMTNNYCQKVYDLFLYYGYENVFGTSYYGGFDIGSSY